jgi:WD repeat-containing protein 6
LPTHNPPPNEFCLDVDVDLDLDLDQGLSQHLFPIKLFKPPLNNTSPQNDHLLNPITALEFHRTRGGSLLILAAEGSFLKVFDAEEARLLHQCEIFSGQLIHGITVRDDVEHGLGLQVAIWGGSNLTLLSRLKFDQVLDQHVSSIADCAIPVSDWILDVAICPFDAVGCVFVTAHNAVVRATLGGSPHTPVLEALHSPSRSILYSAHLIWESPSRVVVAAGTVFGEILVWQCSPSDETSSSKSSVLFTLTGHEGSIFGVNISPPIIGSQGITRLLASCSDDRTIRVWNLSAGSKDGSLATTAVLARETGFGENSISVDHTKSGNSCLAMVMAHASRIWRVRFLGDQSTPLDASAISILSFGEDSTAQQWALHFETDSQTSHPQFFARLDQLHAFAFHRGKHIWSTALRRSGDSKVVLITGGADGKISSYEITVPSCLPAVEPPSPDAVSPPSPGKQGTADELTSDRSWVLDEILRDFEGNDIRRNLVIELPISNASHPDHLEGNGQQTKKTKAKKTLKDGFNRYAFVSENELLVTTTYGRVLLCDIGLKVHWSEISLPESGSGDLRSYAVVVGFPQIGVACLAGVNGSIYVYRHRTLLKLGQVEGKVADMFRIFDLQGSSFELLVTTLAGANAMLFSLDLSGAQVRLLENGVYTLPTKFVVTGAGKINRMLVMGSRMGSLALYGSNIPGPPPQIWKHPGSISRDAITTITVLPSSDAARKCGAEYFLTTSRDGLYSIFSVTIYQDGSESAARLLVRQVHQGVPPFGPMIETGWFEGGKVFLHGFKGKNFVVWNETEQCEVTSVGCGGSHRSYAYSPARGSSSGYFVYTKASRMHLHSHHGASHTIVKAGGHGREIKACAVSGDQSFVATGAEDTAIRIWRYQNTPTLQNPLACSAVIQGHSAGIQHLQWHGSEYLFSSGGNEEFYVWAVEQIPGFGIGVICEAPCPDPSVDRDLRVMGFHVAALPNSSGLHNYPRLLISLAYSDSTIRTYIYSKLDCFQLVCTGRYTSACLTQIRHIRVKDDELSLVTASTDGRLAFWKGCFDTDPRNGRPEPVQLILVSTHRIHQSAIKSLDLMSFNEEILIATGGDDNALGISIFSNLSLVETATPRYFILKSAHAAAITGLCFLRGLESGCQEGTVRLASSGNDQKVMVWSIDLDENQVGNFSLDIKKIGDVFTSIADVGDVSALAVNSEGNNILVVGNGMQVLEVVDRKREDLDLALGLTLSRKI